MTILVSGIMLSLWIYKFQECWYTQAVSECLLTGSNKAVLYSDDYMSDMNRKWENVKRANFLTPQDFMAQIKGDKDKLIFQVSGKTPIWGGSPLQLEIEQEMEIVKPVAYIRKIAAIQGGD